MARPVKIDKKLEIYTIENVWENFEKKKLPVTVTLKDIEEFDASGLQFLMHLFNLSYTFPEKYNIIGITDNLKTKLSEYGFIPEEKDI